MPTINQMRQLASHATLCLLVLLAGLTASTVLIVGAVKADGACSAWVQTGRTLCYSVTTPGPSGAVVGRCSQEWVCVGMEGTP